VLNLRALEVFEAVAAAGGHSLAAEVLDVSQPAVSMQVRQLEEALGVPLFGGLRRQHLTHAGQELLRHARLILQQVRLAHDAVGALGASEVRGNAGLCGLLHLAVVSSAHYFTPSILRGFLAVNNEIRLKLTVARRHEVLTMLQEQRVDLAIMGYPPSEADLEAATFARNPHCIVASPGHPLVGRVNLNWADLRDEQFIFREPGSATRQFLEHLLQREGIQIRTSLEMSGNETVKQAVMCGLGISFLSAHVFQLELEAGRLAVLDVTGLPTWLDWCVVQRRDRPLPPVAAGFRSFVLERGVDAAQCRLA
jgi:DNA-binding transcriptional LysR family regulator